MAAPSTGPSGSLVMEMGTLATSAWSCIHRSLLVAPPAATIDVSSKSWRRRVRKISSVPKQMPSRMARNRCPGPWRSDRPEISPRAWGSV